MFERMRELVDKLNLYNYHYYTLDAPLVVDAVYDKLYSELVALEDEYKFNFIDSPTTRVGGELLTSFEKYTHERPLWSLQKSQSYEELLAWINRVEKLRDEYNEKKTEKLPPLEYVVEYKFDGLTCNLTYESGVLKVAATRGNGIVGENITAQARTIKNVPYMINYRGHIEVQCEAYMPLSELERYNKTAETPLKNARNAAAGALRNLDTTETAKRNLRVFAYNIGYMDDYNFKTHVDTLDFLRDEGFPVNSYSKLVHSYEEIINELEFIKNYRFNLNYLTDGAVIKINDIKTREVMGFTNKFPRWAIAYKYEAEEVETKVLEVVWQVGRTGKITPVAKLDPIEISGAMVSSATLNNIADINRKHVRVGSNVIVRRSNEVIPEIMGTIGDEKDTEEIEIPKICPSCSEPLVMEGAYLVCKNYAFCKPQIVNRIVHFASKNAMNIEGLNEKTVESMVEVLGVSEVSDIYELTKEDLLKLPLFADKKADNLLEAINNSKKRDLHAFIFALGINEVGVKTARDIALKFKSLDNFRNAKREELETIDGVGSVIADNLMKFLYCKSSVNYIDKLLEIGIDPLEMETSKIKDNFWSGKTVVITGTFAFMTRNEIKSILADRGANVTGSVSKKTDLVLVGENPGSKLDKANELGIQIINEEELKEKINE
ncbi:MAG: NAD-dependent DNA ligase LigA [Ezakiella sp.]|nr:NAD-dependent DNA ligase LigA [Ezakiella sp.]MDD7471498.1 NAD-dependent DNA ligase LigA [Bacillota bacterium]MDY3923700.1 NAD-dependent DNA ligase LigA [Ezakiella sp.]